jgi:hypothetical protein
VAYATGLKDELRGTGVWGFIKASKKKGAGGADKLPAAPQKPVPRKQENDKPPSKR